jgi:ABC-type transport system involved in multi-copper enzyme maturation permease subunit
MIRLLKIEFKKLVAYKAFWVMLIIYLVLQAVMIFSIPGLIDWAAEKSGNRTYFRLFKALVFNFPDIWQNIAYVASGRIFIKVILGIIAIILITNEYHFLTIRSNIINGLSRNEFLAGKLGLLFLLAFFSTVVLVLSGLYLGLMNSVSTAASDIFGKTTFIAGYLTELYTYLIFCLFLGIMFKKTGIALIAHVIYMIIEPVLKYKVLPDGFGPYLPINAMNNIVQSPNTSLIKLKSSGFNFDFQEVVSLSDVGLCVGWAILFVVFSWILLKKRNL